MADRSKLGVVALARIIPLSRADFVVTDDGAPDGVIEEIKEAGVVVIVAETRR